MKDLKKILHSLKKIVGKENVLSSPEDLAVYSYDGTFAEHDPDVVVLPTTTQQISEIVKLAGQEKIPIVPRGMASGMAAASVPFSGGIALSMT
ncbi:MAG: FAD-binding oxidoreductase, partial [Calditrichia bacterium]|nr:FAD-binding oxidoreductase [Calditrichia bacterium]